MDAMKALVNVNSRASDVFYCYQINFDKKLHIWKKKKKDSRETKSRLYV